jgi:tRNA pseudouridine55 synthase
VNVLSPEEQRRDGLAIVDKQAGWTSHDVVAKARGLLRNKKIGHSGTLDPDATGVLLLGVGRVTRLLRYLTALPKTYRGELLLGIETTTLDASGDVTATHDMSATRPDDVRAAVVNLTGDILQVPPMVSAVKVDGKRLHQLAREGKEVERAARPVSVRRFEVEPADTPGVYRFVVECSSGTYVRSLVADLGRSLGGGAHMRTLRREAIGSFGIDEARPLDEIEVLAPREALRDYATVVVDEPAARDIGHGKVLSCAALGVEGLGPWAVVDASGDLLAMYERHREQLAKPSVVIAPAPPGSPPAETDG